MHHRLVEQIAAGQSPVHRLDPRIKLPATLLIVVLIAITPERPLIHFLAPAIFVLVGLMTARLPFGFVLSRTLMVLPFVGMIAIFLPFIRGQDVLWDWNAAGISVYREGIESGLAILIKGCLAILAVGWLVFTTPFNHLLQAMRYLKIPPAVVAVLAFLFRYLDLMADESLRMRRARQARCAGRKIRWPARSTGGMVGRLFLRALDRAERVHRAMIARGFDGEIRLLATFKVRSSDICFGATVCVFASFFIFLTNLRGGW